MSLHCCCFFAYTYAVLFSHCFSKAHKDTRVFLKVFRLGVDGARVFKQTDSVSRITELPLRPPSPNRIPSCDTRNVCRNLVSVSRMIKGTVRPPSLEATHSRPRGFFHVDQIKDKLPWAST